MLYNRKIHLVFLVLLIAALACGSEVSTSSPDTSDAGESQQGESTTVPTATIPGSTEVPPEPTDASEPDIIITPLTIVDPAEPSEFVTLEENNRLVGVEVVVANSSQEPIGVNPLDFSLQDTDGFLYDVELAASSQYRQIATLNLLAGERVRGWVFFQVEVGAVPAALEFRESLFSAEGYSVELSAATETHTFNPVSFDVGASLGQPATNSGVEFTGLSIVDPAVGGMFYDPIEGTRLVAIEVQIRNIEATEPVSVNPLYIYLVDDYGFVHEVDLGALGDLEQINTIDLNAGQALKGYVGYALENGHNPAYIRFSLDVFESDSVIAGLSGS